MTTLETDFEFDPFSRTVQEDPFPLYRILRDRHPAYWSAKGDCWVLSRYDDVAHAALHPELYSSAQGNILDDFPGRAGTSLGTTDPPRHNHLRSLINEVFTRRRVMALEPEIRARTVACIDRFVAAGGGCILDAVTGRVATDVVAVLLGFADDGQSDLRGWVSDVLQRDPDTRQMTEAGRASLAALGGYVREQVERRHATPSEDLITALIHVELEGDRLTREEIVWLVFTLIGAGIESSSSLLGNGIALLADHPEQRADLAGDPTAIPQAIEEILRYETSAQRFRRVATRDIELHGQTIREGQNVLLLFGSANRDERQFEDPDRFDVRRKPSRHLGFGHGIHFCLGAALARLSAKIVLEELLARMPDYVVDTAGATRMTSPTFRGFSRLPVAPG